MMLNPTVVVVPYSTPLRSRKSGLVASISTLPARSPNPSTAAVVAGHGVASSNSSAASSASLNDAARGRASLGGQFAYRVRRRIARAENNVMARLRRPRAGRAAADQEASGNLMSGTHHPAISIDLELKA